MTIYLKYVIISYGCKNLFWEGDKVEPSKRLTEIVSLLVRLDPKASALKIKCLLYMLNLYWLQHNNELAFGDKMYKFPLLYFSCKNEYIDDWELII